MANQPFSELVDDGLRAAFCDGVPMEFIGKMLTVNYGLATLLRLIGILEWAGTSEEYGDSFCPRCSTVWPSHDDDCEIGTIVKMMKETKCLQQAKN